MSAASHETLQRIFARACRLGPGERTAYLDRACGGDAALRGEVEALLAADAGASVPLDAALSEGGARFLARELAASGELDVAARHPKRVGRYEILRVIGEGGMGIVYEAQQDDPSRRVALKVIRPTMVTRSLLRRFRHEAQVLGQLQHPGIAQIFEAGTSDTGEGGQPFFALELVDGEPLHRFADGRDLRTRARLDLVARLCDALHHAHQQGVIHRDLKPDNVLVTPGGQPKILDFGVARATNADLHTVTIETGVGQLVGTVPYMSPEQASGDPALIDIRSDVYALGVIAYELLTGHLPYDVRGKLVHEAVRVIREAEPSRLSSIDRGLRGDVETIIAKTLAKEKDRRYQSAAELAADIRRYLADEPIVARPASAMYQLRKFARRNKAIVGGVAAVLVVSIAGTIVAGRYAVTASRNASMLARSSYVAGIAAAVSAIEQHDYVSAAEYLRRTPPALRGWEYEHLRARLTQHGRAWSLPAPPVAAPVFTSDGDRLLVVMEGAVVGEWDAASGALLGTVTLDGIDPGLPVVLSADTRRYAATSGAGRIVIGDLDSGAVLQTLPGDGAPTSIAHTWHDRGRALLYRSDVQRIWSGAASRTLGAHLANADLSPSGDRLAGGRGGVVWIGDTATGISLAKHVIDDVATAVAFSPDGHAIAVGGDFRTLRLLDGHTLEPTRRLRGHQARIDSACWSPDGARLITADRAGLVRVWDPATGECLRVCVAGSMNNGMPAYAVVSPDGRRIATAGPEGCRIFPLEDPTLLAGHESFVYWVTFSPDGTLLASSGFRDPALHLWDPITGRHVARLEAPRNRRHGGSDFDSIPTIGFSSDGRRLVAATRSETVNYDIATLDRLPNVDAPAPDKRFYATLGRRSDARLTPYTVFGPDGRHAIEIIGDRDRAASSGYEISPDGGRVAHLVNDIVVIYDDGATGEAGRLVGHVGVIYTAALSPDGTRIATGGNDATVRLWDAETFEQMLVLRGHEQYVKDVAFSPDGAILASASGDFTVRLWHTRPRVEREVRTD